MMIQINFFRMAWLESDTVFLFALGIFGGWKRGKNTSCYKWSHSMKLIELVEESLFKMAYNCVAILFCSPYNIKLNEQRHTCFLFSPSYYNSRKVALTEMNLNCKILIGIWITHTHPAPNSIVFRSSVSISPTARVARLKICFWISSSPLLKAGSILIDSVKRKYKF